MNKILFAFIGCLCVAGCDSGQSKSWYKEHDEARKQRVMECRNSSKELATPDCQNAVSAQSDIMVFGK